MTPHPDTSISYPVYASDYLDIGGWKGNGSVAGIVDNSNRIIVSYENRYTYDEAKAIADAMNASRNDAILKLAPKGTAKEIRT